jgi:Spy/CpxP family protein refolding chaperone
MVKLFPTELPAKASKERKSAIVIPSIIHQLTKNDKGVAEKMFLRRILPLISLTLAFGAIAYGQQPQTPAPDSGTRAEGMRHREGRSHESMGKGDRDGFGELRGMRELNLTDEQRQQQRAIVQRHLESVKAQREELSKLREKRAQGNFTAEDEARAKALRQEIHNSMQGVHTEIESILTPEQRTKLEQFKTERKARHDEMLKRRQERRENIPQ